MRKKLFDKKVWTRACIFSALYVGLGTLSIPSLYEAESVWHIILLLTFPAIMISNSIVYAGGLEMMWLVYIVQLIMFFCFLPPSYAIMYKWTYRRKNNIYIQPPDS
jgi:hypothetical protein